jgi:hypothetical protein
MHCERERRPLKYGLQGVEQRARFVAKARSWNSRLSFAAAFEKVMPVRSPADLGGESSRPFVAAKRAWAEPDSLELAIRG